MAVIKAEDIHCEKCIERISKAMNEAGFKFQVNLEKKEVIVDGDTQVVNAALEILDDLGFDGRVQ